MLKEKVMENSNPLNGYRYSLKPEPIESLSTVIMDNISASSVINEEVDKRSKTNQENIKKNTKDITKNTRDIAENTKSIDENTEAINENTTSISNTYNKSEVDKKIEETESSIVASKEELLSTISNLEAKYAALNKDYLALKAVVADLSPKTTWEVSEETFKSDMLKTGTIKLTEDVSLGTNVGYGIFATGTSTYNLNGHNLTLGRSSFPAVLVRGSKVFNMGGKGTFECTAPAPVIWCSSVTSEVHLTGNTTTYLSNNDGAECIYCENGTIYITGGIFKSNGNDSRYLLNCKDANYKAGNAKIIVSGGKFYDFDPGNNTAEGPNTSFLAEGYTTVMTEEGEHKIYTVKKA